MLYPVFLNPSILFLLFSYEFAISPLTIGWSAVFVAFLFTCCSWLLISSTFSPCLICSVRVFFSSVFFSLTRIPFLLGFPLFNLFPSFRRVPDWNFDLSLRFPPALSNSILLSHSLQQYNLYSPRCVLRLFPRCVYVVFALAVSVIFFYFSCRPSLQPNLAVFRVICIFPMLIASASLGKFPLSTSVSISMFLRLIALPYGGNVQCARFAKLLQNKVCGYCNRFSCWWLRMVLHPLYSLPLSYNPPLALLLYIYIYASVHSFWCIFLQGVYPSCPSFSPFFLIYLLLLFPIIIIPTK